MSSFSRRAYWTCQLLGWGLFALLNDGLLIARGEVRRGMLPMVAVNAALGLAFTHGLRVWAKRHRWKDRPVASLAPRVVAASVLLAVVTQGLQLSVACFGLRLYSWAEASGVAFVFYVAQSAILYLLWAVLYFGVNAFQRSRHAELDRLSSVAEARTAELKALRDQLNPHFLFNSLNTLRALIAEDPHRAQEAVTRLSSLLRYALGSGEAQTVTLERELAVVSDYLALESLRFEERLTVSIDVPEACLQAPVPVMLVQTLVENAMKHGIAQCPAGGTLSLTARRDNGELRVEVTNPSPEGRAHGANGAGVGLANARERLRLLFGDSATLVLDASGPLTRAEVRIPCR